MTGPRGRARGAVRGAVRGNHRTPTRGRSSRGSLRNHTSVERGSSHGDSGNEGSRTPAGISPGDQRQGHNRGTSTRGSQIETKGQYRGCKPTPTSNTLEEPFETEIPSSKRILVDSGLKLYITFKRAPDEKELEQLSGFHSLFHPKDKELVRIVLFTDVESLEASQVFLSGDKNVESTDVFGLGSLKRQEKARNNCWISLIFKQPYAEDAVMELDGGIQEINQHYERCCKVRFGSPAETGSAMSRLKGKIGYGGLIKVEFPGFVWTYKKMIASIQDDSVVLRDVPKDIPYRCITDHFPDMVNFKLYDKTFPASKYCHAILQFKSPKRVTEILKKKFMMIADKKVYPIPAYQEFFQDYPELGEERDDEETDMLAFEIKNGLQLNITFKTEPKYEELRKLPGFHSASIPRSKQLSRIVLFKNLESLEEAQDILSQQKNVESAQLMGFRSVTFLTYRYFTLIFWQPYEGVDAVRRLESQIEKIVPLSQKSCSVYFACPETAYNAYHRLRERICPNQNGVLQKIEVPTVVKNLWNSVDGIRHDCVVLRDVPKDVPYRCLAEYFPDALSFQLFYKTFPASDYCHGVFIFNNTERAAEILNKTDMMLAGKKVFPFPAYQEFFGEFPELGVEDTVENKEQPVASTLNQKEPVPLAKKIKIEAEDGLEVITVN